MAWTVWGWQPLSLLCGEYWVSVPDQSGQGFAPTTPFPLIIEVKNG